MQIFVLNRQTELWMFLSSAMSQRASEIVLNYTGVSE